MANPEQAVKDVTTERAQTTRLFIPALAPLYGCLAGLAYPLIRIVWGLLLVFAGWSKLTGPMFEGDAALLHGMGWEPAVALMWFITALEFVGGAMLTIGLLTRPIAVAVFIQMMVITFVVPHPSGRFDTFAFVWGLMALAISWRGGGPCSLDRLIGKEF